MTVGSVLVVVVKEVSVITVASLVEKVVLPRVVVVLQGNEVCMDIYAAFLEGGNAFEVEGHSKDEDGTLKVPLVLRENALLDIIDGTIEE